MITEQQLDLLPNEAVEAINAANLSTREREVAIAIAKGEFPRNAAKRLGITVKTYSTYRTRIFDKLRAQNLNVKSTAQLAVLFYQAELIPGVM